MEGHIVNLVTHVDTVKKLWDYLEVLYSGQNNMARIFEVSHEFFRISRDGRPLTQFFADFKKLIDLDKSASKTALLTSNSRPQSYNCGRGRYPSRGRGRRFSSSGCGNIFNVRTGGRGSQTTILGPCYHYGEFGHVQHFCRHLSSNSKVANVAECGLQQSVASSNSTITLSPTDYAAFTQFQISQQPSPSTAGLVQRGNASACLTTSLPWPVSSVPCVTLANDSKAIVMGTGTATLSASLSLPSTLYMPDFPFNLLSDFTMKKEIGRGHVSGGLYVFDEPVSRSTACSAVVSPLQFGKHHRVCYPPRVNKRSAHPFDLVHSEIWGPCPVDSKLNFCYFVLFHVSPRIFGCVCFVRDHRACQSKLDPKALKCLFVGYSRTQKGYRYLSTHIITTTTTTKSTVPSSRSSSEIWHVYSRRSRPNDGSRDIVPPAFTLLVDPSPTSDLELPLALRKGIQKCTQHPISASVSYSCISPSYSVSLSTMDTYPLPKTCKEALSNLGWKLAMLEELAALEENKTWEFVHPPPNSVVIGSKWVFAVKLQPDGSFSILKARLVAKRYAQVYGVNYFDTFSPVAKMSSIRLLILLAASHNWKLHQLDVKNVFLHGDLHEIVYMEQPPGFVAQGEPGMVFKLKKTIYGLKQSPREWFGKFSTTLIELE
ncbi:uncharacterized protein LOC141673295 [Apium graveolens]|uniref:uncharacterized protein LOC141673295 n=1 Tax=Apium graveolens TaxID=4045 RepID=UPI003D7A0A6F